jgi:hypothetical protein
MKEKEIIPDGMKKVPVRWEQEFCLWHLKYGPKDTGFPSTLGGFKNLLDGLNAIADFNMIRLKEGKESIRVSAHAGLEIALGVGHGNEFPVYAGLVNTPEAIPYPVLRAWMNNKNRANFEGTPNFGGFPVAAFGREIWGNRGSYCSTNLKAVRIGKWTWYEAKKIMDDMRQFPWGENVFLLNWGGNNSQDADEADPNEIVTIDTYKRSDIWSLERDHLIWVIEELDEMVNGEPKLFHPGWLVAGTTGLFIELAKEVNAAMNNEPWCICTIEFAHLWSDGDDLDDGFRRLRKNKVFVNRKGRAQMHGGGGIKTAINLAAAIESTNGIKRGDISVTPDMDYELAHITTQQMSEVKRSIKDTIKYAGVIPETWTDVDEVVITVSWDVRHAGFKDPLTKQVRCIKLLDEMITEAENN